MNKNQKTEFFNQFLNFPIKINRNQIILFE